MHLTLAGGSLWRKQMSVCGNKRAPVEHVILFLFQRGHRQECPKHGQETQRLDPYSQGTMVTCVTWDVPFRRELYSASSWGRYGNAIPTPPCWGMSVRIAGFLSHRLEEHHPCPADLESTSKLKARHHRLSLRVWLSEWRSQESDSLDWAETSTLNAINS